MFFVLTLGKEYAPFLSFLLFIYVPTRLAWQPALPRQFRSQIAYNRLADMRNSVACAIRGQMQCRWWEGGTLLQQTRGEWFNCFSSLVAPRLCCCCEEWGPCSSCIVPVISCSDGLRRGASHCCALLVDQNECREAKAFTNPAPELACRVEEFQHLLATFLQPFLDSVPPS